MTDEPALLATILAHPDEDTPRLMFADWLQEHNQPLRAEFVRVQVQLADLLRRMARAGLRPTPRARTATECKRYPELFALLARQALIWPTYGEWFPFGPLPQDHAAATCENIFNKLCVYAAVNHLPWVSLTQRGFLKAVQCPAASWLAHADAILARHPVERVRLTDVPGALGQIRLGWRNGHKCQLGFRGRKMHVLALPPSAPGSESTWPHLLEAEWPSIGFERGFD
ncbi:leucine-rich repeat-containing protein typical subtype : Repeat-companion domain protein OS=Isosphaera pallida (strain ATCC 43644 / DSM 9630 / IS1B) GN=Isop_0392 PE=4 SV=1 [Gemmata massiliana]|uniref:Leucine-rich repeat-containing protein typical subtype: Repeat-companion domain protein n=1 Tax=Gemmata massiliana TaxID=1210884 RepID=A0A6P2CVQ9_9BACT|nr:TIGR02996 domain-containing protein [Gemmata massiliana]VTR93228.1 leucine-rich repeat-containing protein typical subtype : Repeat-companion domain protein OS=Isosphaera pallida (strain ATCC 43644 / DSM 9630 / IS1B) GN=Isop_0392 PE=4 SV=1 [Gemmata massiliana]